VVQLVPTAVREISTDIARRAGPSALAEFLHVTEVANNIVPSPIAVTYFRQAYYFS